MPKKEYETLMCVHHRLMTEGMLSRASGYHDNGHNGDRGNPDKGGWKDKHYFRYPDEFEEARQEDEEYDYI